MHQHTSHHIIRIDRSCYSRLDAAITQRLLRPCEEGLTVMHSARVYRPAEPLLAAQSIAHDRCLNLGSLRLEGEFYRVPEQEYTTMIAGSTGAYRQYPGAQGLLGDLLAPMTSSAERAWWQRVRHAVAQGRRPAMGADLVDDNWVPTGWLHERTRLLQVGREWFAALHFSQPARMPVPCGRGIVGVDVGLRPLATAAWGVDHEVTYAVHDPAVRQGEAAEVVAFAQILSYCAARAALETFTVPVLLQARTLVLEDLDYGTFTSRFPADARRRAVADWHQSWAPQRAYSRGIQVVRVRSAHSSRMCSRCQRCTFGVRTGQMFHCPRGHALDAHVNAARNLVRRYWSDRRRAGGRR